MRDWCFRPQCLERLQQLLPQARSVELSEAGHYVMEDAHEQVVTAIGEFLKKHPLTENARS
jgi:haloalkane dehalogenase